MRSENAPDFIEALGSIVLFISAFSIILVMWRNSAQVNKYVNENTTQRNITTNHDEGGTYNYEKKNTLTKYDVANEIAAHRDDETIRIYVDNLDGLRAEFTKGTSRSSAFTSTRIHNTGYARTYVVTEKGTVTELVYVEVLN